MAAYYHTQQHTSDLTPPPDHTLHHTLILMNPNFPGGAAYPESHAPQPPTPPPSSHNILLLNSAAAAAAATSTALSHPPIPLHHPHSHQFVRLPPPLHHQQDNITLYGYPQPEAREFTRARQGLSLSLSSQNPQYGPGRPNGPDGLTEGDMAGGGGQSPVLSSKYLKAAQELLEEVVHVGDGKMFKTSDSPKKTGGSGKGVGDSSEENRGGSSGGGGGGGAQLSSTERQEVQMKKAKLVTMLDEAEQRYRIYHHQMQIVITSFEQVAGFGSAKTYTALALKTISKQFRCLKDAIQAQIRAASKSLGEEETGGGGSGPGSSGGNKIEGSRLKYIDHQIRQQRALQQLGMIQNHNAWRPQRGLPERSVSVLRAWLFEHFLHPYPKDSDKIMLAKQTGLTRSQVSNWFINARVRLWKPMIEEMYTEEVKEQEHQNGSEEKTSSKENSNVSNCATDQDKLNNISSDQDHQANNKGNFKDQNSTVSSYSSSLISIPTSSLHQNQHGFTQGSPKRPRNNESLHCDGNNREVFIKIGNDNKQQDRSDNGYPIISGAMNFVGGGGELESYPTMGEFPPPRFLPGNGNGISLSLGLPPFENHQQQQQQQMNLSATNHTFLSPNPNMNQFRSRANDFGPMSSPSSHSSAAGFECIDIENRKGFAAQLLPDFVA